MVIRSKLRVWGLCCSLLSLPWGVGCQTGPVVAPPSGGTTGGTSSGPTAPGSTPAVTASLLEQLALERINRARLRPAAEASANGIAIDEGVPGQLDTRPKPAIALNAALISSARSHSQDMLARDYFEHNSPEGRTPFDRMMDAGYVFIYAGENLAWRGSTGSIVEADTVEAQHRDFFVDAGIEGRGHRVTMLNRNYREVGIGIIRGAFTRNGITYDSLMQTQDFGTTPNDAPFVLGVVYSDANANGQYDFGEGVAGSAVTLASVTKTTNAAGGYSFEVLQPGTYTLRFAGNRTTSITTTANGPNVKVDLVNGRDIVVNLGLGPL